MNHLPDRITRESPEWPVQPGRYRLVAAPACPWANRSVIVRTILGLEDVISMGRGVGVRTERMGFPGSS